MRGFDENKKWKQKQKTVFANAVDEQGRAIFDPDLPSYDPKRKKETADLRIPLLDENGKQKTRVNEQLATLEEQQRSQVRKLMQMKEEI